MSQSPPLFSTQAGNKSATMGESFRLGQNMQNNTGTSVAGNPSNFVQTSSANASQTDALQQASADREGADYNRGGDSITGVTPNPNSSDVPLDLTRVNSLTGDSYKMIEVGTTVNTPRPDSSNNAPSFKGTPSLFNNYYLVRYHSLNDKDSIAPNKLAVREGEVAYMGLADDPLYKNPTTSIIISKFNGQDTSKFSYPEKIYSYSDFLYMKYYNPYGNNKLITLRRFMSPVYDECRTVFKKESKEFRKPIAKALNYLGVSGNSFSTLSAFTVGIPTESIKGAGVAEKSQATNLTTPDPGGKIAEGTTDQSIPVFD